MMHNEHIDTWKEKLMYFEEIQQHNHKKPNSIFKAVRNWFPQIKSEEYFLPYKGKNQYRHQNFLNQKRYFTFLCIELSEI